ncbi:Hypothetical predicted protein [Mytilus galloprovincialis]|uniref:Uncharacterized protein n=1 Tax=Mytilus galloprovincialis TaxID=29158 RepID=A0A8B6CPW5_MYTGA|nr:Hypothetical predicted protein [Mytilus galloprovincialis]
MSTEKPTLSVMTSKPVNSSMNTEITKGPVEKTDLEKSTEAVNTSLIDHQATTVETRLTSTQSSEQLSTILDNPQKKLPDKKPTDQPIDPAIIVLALTSFLTFVLVVIGFVIGRSRYVESRLHRKHSNTNQEEIKLDKKETGVKIEQNVHRVYKDDAI